MSQVKDKNDEKLSFTKVKPDLASYLTASRKQFEACIDKANYTVEVNQPRTDVDLYYVKFDANGEPKFDTLVKVLAKHVVRYTLSMRTRSKVRSDMEDTDEGDLLFLARGYFRKIQTSGEVGELLLFFLLEAALGAPQVVCKMELKTNPRDEIKGADGIHVKWDDGHGHMDVYLGESKLHKKLSNGITDIFRSLTKFYDDKQLDDELKLVTANFRFLDEELKEKVTHFINMEDPEGECHIIHACLIGWDWSKYKQLLTNKRDEFLQTFKEKYKDYIPTLENLLNDKFRQFKYKHLTFRFFFLPFKNVGDFRREFYRVLCGVDIGNNNS